MSSKGRGVLLYRGLSSKAMGGGEAPPPLDVERVAKLVA